MAGFDDIIGIDAAVFIDPDAFPGVESVTITFKTGTTRTVYAQVFRDEPVPFGDGYLPKLLLSFVNSSTTGLAASEIDGGAVKVTVAKEYGGTPKEMPMRRCTDPDKRADAGMVWVEVG